MGTFPTSAAATGRLDRVWASVGRQYLLIALDRLLLKLGTDQLTNESKHVALPISPLLWDEVLGLHSLHVNSFISKNGEVMVKSFNSLSPIRLKKSAFAKRASRILNGPRSLLTSLNSWSDCTSIALTCLFNVRTNTEQRSSKLLTCLDCWLDQNILKVSSLIYSVSHSMSPKFSLASLIFSSNLASHTRHFRASNHQNQADVLCVCNEER